MTTTDPSRSPAGTESAWAYTHVPHDIRGDAGTGVSGRWDASDADRMADRIEGEIELRAPGFRSLIRARHVFTPPGFEAIDANLVGGAVGGGTAHLGQQLIFRPFPVTWGAHAGPFPLPRVGRRPSRGRRAWCVRRQRGARRAAEVPFLSQARPGSTSLSYRGCTVRSYGEGVQSSSL